MFHISARHFFKNETGAVTVDWTVMTAAALTVALATAVIVGNGTTTLGTTINATLGSLFANEEPVDPADVAELD